jgi:hypothetical protein
MAENFPLRYIRDKGVVSNNKSRFFYFLKAIF